MKARVTAIGIIGLVSEPVLAAVTPPAAGSLAQMVLGLIGVLAIIVGGAWLLKRYGQLPGAGYGGALRVLGGVSLGPRERAVLIQVGEKQLLLGVTPGCVRTLHVLDQPAVTIPAERSGGGAARDFSERLTLLLRSGRTS